MQHNNSEVHDDSHEQEEEEGTLILDEEIDEDYEPTEEGTPKSNQSQTHLFL